MAAAKPETSSGARAAGQAPTPEDLANDIEQIKADVAELVKQLQKLGEHSYGTARRAATEGVSSLREQGEAAIDDMRARASEVEDQITSHVREKPITSLAIAAGVGFLFALLSRR